eukprot:6705923-Heterocapsa_arctica.AAC.1
MRLAAGSRSLRFNPSSLSSGLNVLAARSRGRAMRSRGTRRRRPRSGMFRGSGGTNTVASIGPL